MRSRPVGRRAIVRGDVWRDPRTRATAVRYAII